jgi:hypothetical protein
VGRSAGWVAGCATLAGLAVVWLVLPLRLSHRARREGD